MNDDELGNFAEPALESDWLKSSLPKKLQPYQRQRFSDTIHYFGLCMCVALCL